MKTFVRTCLNPAWPMAWVMLALTAWHAIGAEEPAFYPQNARDYYNEGAQRLQKGKLRDAEASLQTALSYNDERIQPPALYNLGHVRFMQGVQILKDAPQTSQTRNTAVDATNRASQAIAMADAALAQNQVEPIVQAYMHGKGVARDMKKATEAVKKAMETYGAVLNKWQRASGDFKSACELQEDFKDARFNGDVVDKHIAALVDKKNMIMPTMESMNGKRKELKEKLEELKKKLPDGMQKDKEGEGGDEDDEEKPPENPKPGEQEKNSEKEKDGKEMSLTWEEAVRLLNSLKLDGNRKLPMGDQETAQPKDRKGKDW